MSRPRRVRAEVASWVEGEVKMAVRDFLADEVVRDECPAALSCLREIADELRKPDPSWEATRDSIRAARRASPRWYRRNFDRLEARLGHLFSHRKRDWARP